MEAVIKVSAEEFDENLFRRLKDLFEQSPKASVTISINGDQKNLIAQEFHGDALQKAIENVELGKNTTTFTIGEFEDFKKQLLNEP